MSAQELVRALDGSYLAEVGFRRSDGTAWAAVLVPLVEGGTVTFALPYSDRALAEALAASPAVLVATSDSRAVGRSWAPMAGQARVSVLPDPNGAVFCELLLEQELRKHPPARAYADSLLLRREHWWYLPRLLVRLDPQGAWPLAARVDPRQATLFSWGAEPDVRTVEVAGDSEQLVLSGLNPPDRPWPASAPACALRHDRRFPDLEQATTLVEAGELRGDRLVVAVREGSLALPQPRGVLARYRALRAFEQACRRELAVER